MPVLADSLDQLDSAWFTAALRDAGVVDASRSVSSAEVRLFGTGQFGLVAQATLEYDGDAPDAPASVIVKLPSSDEGSRQFAVASRAYEVEVLFYREMVKRVDASTPRMYWADFEPENGRVTIVLEDLSVELEAGDSVKGGTVEQAREALRQLVLLQAPSWDDPSLREVEWLASPLRTQAFFDIIEPALPAFRERFGPSLTGEQMALVERLVPKAKEYPAKAWAGPLVVMHGDFRLDNLLFAPDGAATVIDWQSVRLGPPLIDAGIYLSTCLTPDDRRAHQEELLREYHAGLVAAGVGGFSWEQCWESYRQGSLWTFLLGVGASVTLAQSERGDAMFAALVSQSADMVVELDAAGFLT